MAQSERFYFWRGFYDALKRLETDEQRGAFVMALCAYAFDGEDTDLSWDATLDFAFAAVKDQVLESVNIGRIKSEAGSKGGRPQKRRSATKKSTAKSSALSSAKSTVKSSDESVRYSNVPSSPKGEEEGASLRAASAAQLAPEILPDGSTRLPDGAVIPPRPKDWGV